MKYKIEKNTVQETLIIPLYARKVCSELYPNLYRDETAVRLIDEIDYDFSEAEKKSRCLMQRFGSLEVAMRQNDLAWEVRDYLKAHLAPLRHEVFFALWLDAQNRLLVGEELFRGTLTQTSVYPREVVKRALAHNAAAVILAHNHPSGVADPSSADERLTRELKQALALVDVKVLDHFIVAGNASPLSFAERGCL